MSFEITYLRSPRMNLIFIGRIQKRRFGCRHFRILYDCLFLYSHIRLYSKLKVNQRIRAQIGSILYSLLLACNYSYSHRNYWGVIFTAL
jgi:hypothetical protein